MAIVTKTRPDELRRVLASCRGYFVTAGVFSLAVNLLYLAAPIYMLQVYDRVISSASHLTLLMLTIALLVALTALTGLDAARSYILTRASLRLDRLIAPRVMTSIIDRSSSDALARSQLLRDFDSVRQFVTGQGIRAIFDLPWAPLYVAVIAMLHPLLGAFALGSAVVLLIMALVNESIIRGLFTESQDTAARSYGFTEMCFRNSEVIRAMGMKEGLLRRWALDRNQMLDCQIVVSDRSAIIQSMIRFLRLSMQSLILALGAYLVIERSVTVGAMFAGSILLGRALQPVEQIVGSWRGLVTARAAFRRVRDLLAENPPAERKVQLPRPRGRLAVENLTCLPPGVSSPILRSVTFSIEPGEALGVIGPTGSGKSTLARHLVGVLRPQSGSVRLDGADVCQWPDESRGLYVGYLPQDIELFADTVARNVSRFRDGDDEDDAAIIRAAQLAGLHEAILQLAKGYETQMGDGTFTLSGGLRQRVGLARAVYGNPRLVVLDEPNSNLDAEGESALIDCVRKLKQEGTTVVLISHRPGILGVVDKLLVMKGGAVESFGPSAEIIARLTRNALARAAPAA